MDSTNRKLRFIVDSQGNRVSVVLDLDQYEDLVRAREELADIRAYDKAKGSKRETIPFEEAVREIETKWT